MKIYYFLLILSYSISYGQIGCEIVEYEDVTKWVGKSMNDLLCSSYISNLSLTSQGEALKNEYYSDFNNKNHRSKILIKLENLFKHRTRDAINDRKEKLNTFLDLIRKDLESPIHKNKYRNIDKLKKTLKSFEKNYKDHLDEWYKLQIKTFDFLKKFDNLYNQCEVQFDNKSSQLLIYEDSCLNKYTNLSEKYLEHTIEENELKQSMIREHIVNEFQ